MHGDDGKILGTFCNSFDVRLLEIETSPEKFRRVEKESIKLEHNVTNELAVDFKTFCICKTQLRLFHAIIRLNFGLVC